MLRHRRENFEEGFAQADRILQRPLARTGHFARPPIKSAKGARGKRARLLAKRDQVAIFTEPFFTVLGGTVADRVGEIEREISAAQIEAKVGSRLRHQETGPRCFCLTIKPDLTG